VTSSAHHPAPPQQGPRRRVLVSGGTSGIGLACAAHLALTDDVWILGSSPATVDRAVSESAVAFAGSGACDVSDPAAVERAIAEAVATMGGLDAAFVNAGIDGEGKPAAELSHDHFRHVLEVNVLGSFAVSRAALRHLTRPGTLVLNASVNALKPERNFLDYNVSKAATLSMAASLALEVSEEGITVIALCPGYFPTPMTAAYLDDPEKRTELLSHIPARRFGELAEVAQTVDFLLSPAARFMTGGVVTLDGGAHL
jgi:NAD(P)-dependent dehydrogenase (short-subunit alcohol dehydrogenase family)